MDRQEQLMSRLRDWVASEAANGEDVPSSELVARIADEAAIPTDVAEPALNRWKGKIQAIIDDVGANVSELTRALAPDTPTPAQVDELAEAEDEVDAFELLVEWREAATASGVAGASEVSDANLRTIVKFWDRPERFAGRLSPTVLALLPHIASYLGIEKPDLAAEDTDESEPPQLEFDDVDVDHQSEDTGEWGTSGRDGQGDTDLEFDAEAAAESLGASSTIVAPVEEEEEAEVDLTTGWATYSGPPPASELDRMRTTLSDSGIQMSWAPPPGDLPVVVYRVVAEDNYRPYSPEAGRTIAITQGLECVDLQPLHTPMRYVQVWCHKGESLAEAKAAQAEPVAETIVVTPPQDVLLAEDEGKVVGQWHTHLEDSMGERRVIRVDVTRYRVGHPAGMSATAAQPIAVDSPNLGGFVDETAERGESYIYRLVVEALSTDQQRRLSAPIDLRLDVSAELMAVDDLTMSQANEPGGSFELTWTAPKAGRVRIYRLETAPPGGIDHTVEPLGALASMGLLEDSRLMHPMEPADPVTGLSSMQRVPWPASWRRVFCTPVTVLGEQMIVGRTVSTAGVDAIKNASLVERVNGQILRFAWPSGAASVQVHVGPQGASPEAVAESKPVKSIDLSLYRRLGGIPMRLPAGGCRVVLVPAVFDGGQSITGKPTWVDYTGLRRLTYSIGRVKQFGFMKAPRLSIKVWEFGTTAATQHAPSPPFILVYNAERLPLYAQDGVAIPVFEENGGESSTRFQPRTLAHSEEMPEYRAEMMRGVKGGYVRLFAGGTVQSLSGIAVLDPPIDTLQLA